jgi:hypothetical protein
MFEFLFRRQSTVARYRSAPLVKERLLYLAHCERIGIKPETLCKIAVHQLNLVRGLDLRDDDGSNLRKIEAGFRQWSLPGERQSRPRVRRRFYSHAERWLRFLGWLEESETVCRHTHTPEVAAFTAHMSGERGWSDATIEGCRRTVDGFFAWLDEREVDLASVGITMIDQIIAGYHARGYSRSTIYLYAQQLRTFFRFAEQQRWCMPGLAGGIMPPRRYPGETIPKGLNRDEVIRLLATSEGGPKKKAIRCAVLHPPHAPHSSLPKAAFRPKRFSCLCAGESNPPPKYALSFWMKVPSPARSIYTRYFACWNPKTR